MKLHALSEKKMQKKWRSYSSLAWTEPIVGPPEDYREETELFTETIIKNSKVKPKTLLGGGGIPSSDVCLSKG